jgi:iron complex outermembrane receptor protein
MARQPRFRQARCSAVLTAVLLTIAPGPGYTDGLVPSSDRFLSDEIEMLKEEESVSMESRDEQPFSPLSSERRVMTDEDIRGSCATDLPTLLLRILGLDVPQGAEPDINGRVRVDRQLIGNRILLVVDGRSTHIDTSHAPPWDNILVTLSDIKRMEVWNESASTIHGSNGYDAAIKIRTKTPEK